MSLSRVIAADFESLSQELITPSVGEGSEIDFESRYFSYMVLLHYVVRASVPLMQNASGKCELGDELLRSYLQKQIAEEENHDSWILEDMATLPNPPKWELFQQPPPQRVANLVGSQYYLINHYDKVALLGYILALESHPPSIAGITNVIEISGLPKAAFRTLLHHAEVDISHMVSLNSVIDNLNLRDSQRSIIRKNALNTSLEMRLILSWQQAHV